MTINPIAKFNPQIDKQFDDKIAVVMFDNSFNGTHSRMYYALPKDRADEFVQDYKNTGKKNIKQFSAITALGTIATGVLGFAAARKSNILLKILSTGAFAVTGLIGSSVAGLVKANNNLNKLTDKYDAMGFDHAPDADDIAIMKVDFKAFQPPESNTSETSKEN